MSLGLPSHLATRATSSAFVRGLHTIGLTCLVCAALAAVIFQFGQPGAIVWPAILALLPLIALLGMRRRLPTLFFAISYLFVGGLCAFWYLVTFSAQTPPIVASDAFSVDLPLVALVMVGGAGTGPFARFAWCFIGYATAEIAGNAALLAAGLRPAVHQTTAVAFAVTTLVLILAWAGRRRARRAQRLLHIAAREEQLASVRYRIESRAAALMHDTVLNHLAAIANSSEDELGEQLTAQIVRDLEILIGEEWLDDNVEMAVPGWDASGIFVAITEMRALGLKVESTGDLAAVSRLSSSAAAALGLAVKQCLVNVLRHAATERAEVVIFGSTGEISVMVIDAGRGFSTAETGADRLGLRTSVRRRIEAVGGAVQVWSTPGRGTSIMITIPTTVPAASMVGGRK